MPRVSVEVTATDDRLVVLRVDADDQGLVLEMEPDSARRLSNLLGEAILASSKIPEVRYGV